jgi:hypothetical protein
MQVPVREPLAVFQPLPKNNAGCVQSRYLRFENTNSKFLQHHDLAGVVNVVLHHAVQ